MSRAFFERRVNIGHPAAQLRRFTPSDYPLDTAILFRHTSLRFKSGIDSY